MQGQLVTTIFVLLLASIIFVPITKKLGLSSVLGYLLAGMIIGKGGFNLIQDVSSLAHISEFGIVLFMFLIGLELKPSVLQEMKKDILRYGLLQLLITSLVFYFITYSTSKNIQLSFIIGLSFTLSSTALGIQILQEKNLLKSPAGRASMAVLLFQDLAIIPMMGVVSLLATNKSLQSSFQFDYQFILKIFFATFLAVVVGKYLLKYIFRFIATAKLREIFTSVSLLLVIAMALLMESVGLTMAFGSFLAGLLMADSEFRYELEISIEPFKGLLMGLFFMSVAMDMDISLFFLRPLDVIGLALAIVLVKFSLLYLMSSIFGLTIVERLIFSIATSQVGEFAFVLLAMGLKLQILNPALNNLLSLVIAMSMVFTPLLFLLVERWDPYRRKIKTIENNQTKLEEQHQVIIAGFGRFGTIVARLLHANGIGTTVLDHDPNQIELVRKFGFKAYYGDVTRLDLLEAAGVEQAKILIIAVDEMEMAKETVERVKQHYPKIQIFVRCRNRNDFYEFKAQGIKVIIRETFSSALEMGEEVLKGLGFGSFESRRIVKKFRIHDEKYLEESFLHYENMDALVGLAKKSRLELERTLEEDRAWMQREGNWK